MTERVAWLLVWFGLALMVSGCANPLSAAVATTNAAARTLRVAHEELAERYEHDQFEAARRVLGDRNDPSVKAEQLDRILVVRAKYAKAWDAYHMARSAWVTAQAAVRIAGEVQDAGGIPSVLELVPSLQQMAKALQEFVAAAEELAQ